MEFWLLAVMRTDALMGVGPEYMLVVSLLLVVWNPLCLDPSEDVFGRFDLAALCGCNTLMFVMLCCGTMAGR